MENIVRHIQQWFVAKREHFESFARNDTRLESWFKGELLVLLERLKLKGLIEDFEREPNFHTDEGRKQVDFKVKINAEEHLCELKAACISRAMGTPRNLKFYFRDDDVGLLKDFKKLDLIVSDNNWVIAFIYPKPSESDWTDAVASLPANLRHWHCVTELVDYPQHLFIAFWHA